MVLTSPINTEISARRVMILILRMPNRRRIRTIYLLLPLLLRLLKEDDYTSEFLTAIKRNELRADRTADNCQKSWMVFPPMRTAKKNTTYLNRKKETCLFRWVGKKQE